MYKYFLNPLLFLVILLVVLDALVAVLPQQAMGMIVDTITMNPAGIKTYVLYPLYLSIFGDAGSTTNILILFLVISLLSLLISMLRGYFVSLNAENIMRNLRQKLFSGLLRSNYTYLSSLSSGESSLRQINDVENIRGLLVAPVNGLLVNLFEVLFMTYLCFRISSRLSWIMLIPVPLVIFNSFVIGNRQLLIASRIRDQLSLLSNTAITRIKGFMLFKLFAKEDDEEIEYQNSLDQYLHLQKCSFGTTMILFPFTSGIRIVNTIVVLFVGIDGVQTGNISVGELLIFIQYMGRFYSPFIGIARYYNGIATSLVSYRKVVVTLSETDLNKEFIQSGSNIDAKLEPTDLILSFEEVDFDYQEENAKAMMLNKLSFKVHKKDKLAIVGESGKGKTTILNLIIGLLKPKSGRILFYGKDVRELDKAYLRRKIGYLSQNSILYSIPLIDNLRYGSPQSSQEEIIQALKRVNLNYMSNTQALFAMPGEGGEMLSGGEKQRIALVRLMLCDPDLILLDEPISNLDHENAKSIMDLIFELFGEKTIIITSHQPLAIAYAQKVIEM